MSRKHYKPEQIILMLREAEVQLGKGGSKDIVYRTWEPVGERVYGIVHWQIKGRITQPGDI